METNADRYVEAIVEGRIMRVPESYAREENLPIIKKSRMYELKERVAEISERKAREIELDNKKKLLDNFQKPVDWKANHITAELVENFHWQIIRARKNNNLSRKQLATMIHEPEAMVKAIEYGTLPANNFIIINKLQEALGIKLRKHDMSHAPQNLIEIKSAPAAEPKAKDYSKMVEDKRKNKHENHSVVGNEIEILDEE